MVSKLSIVPYYTATVFLTLFLFDSLLEVFMQEHGLSIEDDIGNKPILKITKRLLQDLRFMGFIAFINVLSLEMILLRSFMVFQDNYRVESLPLEKQNYNKQEVRVMKCVIGVVSFFLAILLVIGILRALSSGFHFSSNDFIHLLYWITIFMGLVISGIVLLFTNVVVLITMHNKHYYAFKRHIWP